MVLTGDVRQTRLEIPRAAKDRLLFAEAGRADINRLAEMTDEIAPDVSGAALAAVQERHATCQAAEDHAGSQRRAEFTGIARGGIRDRTGCGHRLRGVGKHHPRNLGRALTAVHFDCAWLQHYARPLCRTDAKPVRKRRRGG